MEDSPHHNYESIEVEEHGSERPDFDVRFAISSTGERTDWWSTTLTADEARRLAARLKLAAGPDPNPACPDCGYGGDRPLVHEHGQDCPVCGTEL